MYEVSKYNEYRKNSPWAVTDPAGELVCLCTYRKGAVAVVDRLTPPPAEQEHDGSGI